MRTDNLIGIDIGGTKCAVILGDTSGHISRRIAFGTETDKGVNFTLANIKKNVKKLLKNNRSGSNKIKRIGVSCGGPMDSSKGIILSPPNLPGWDNIRLKDILEKEFKTETRVMNDANACAAAEWKWGAGRGCKNIIFLTFGTGMGAGLIINNRLYSGANGLAGEVGHIRLEKNGPAGYGKEGSFEGFCSGGGIALAAKAEARLRLERREKVGFCGSPADIPKLTAKTVAKAALNGDPLALEIMKNTGSKLGMGISILLDILNPEIIIIGSIFARCRTLLAPEMEKTIRAEALASSRKACRIVPPGLGEKIGDYGALAAAMDL